MGFINSLLEIVGLGIGVPLGLVVGYFLFLRFEPKDVKDPLSRPLHEFDTHSLLDLLPEVPLWVKHPDFHRVDWLNRFLRYMWPYLDQAICNLIRSSAQPIFGEYVGSYQIKALEFEKLSLGTLPPAIHGVKVHETNENELVLEPAIRWAGNPNIILVLKLLFLRIRVQEIIRKQIANLYLWPQTLEIPILDGPVGAIKKPVGILHVKVIQARKLLKMDLLGTSDPYVKLSLSGEKLPAKRTTVKMNNLNPEWNESFNLTVKDLQSQVLELHVYDWEKFGTHDKLGMQVVPLTLISSHEPKEFTLNLVKNQNLNDPHNKKPRGQLMVELSYHPLKEDSHRLSGPLERHESQSSESEVIERPNEEASQNCQAGLLLVTVQGAEDVDGMHHTNPYALVLFRGEEKKTKLVKRTRDPCWNEEFQFVLEEAPLKEEIRIQVMSRRTKFCFHFKESLGYVDINLSDVVFNGHINEKFHLINSRNGVVHVEIRWEMT
ncbi:synaptotagmin-3-like isoform X3 [Syzygium oleosum]|uniref:synaptotagmin-3-like isoform X3 n=1 Tax=Syzygium oleosum TaxID=219896 RepID=UPI0024BB289A|nr:synaptotagmin-3-like isoform X3 [Syzygium oleosum]